MSQSKLDSRFVKTLKKRTAKSPLSSTAADTLLHLTRNIEKPEMDSNYASIQSLSSKRTGSELLKKSLKRAQSTEYLKILSEKNLNIKKLQDDNHNLSSQLADMLGIINKYQKLRSHLKDISLVIRVLIEKTKLDQEKAASVIKIRKNIF